MVFFSVYFYLTASPGWWFSLTKMPQEIAHFLGARLVYPLYLQKVIQKQNLYQKSTEDSILGILHFSQAVILQSLSLFGYMLMVADMVLAVTVVALATGAIAELQFRVADISTAADGAFVGIGRLHTGSACLVRTGVGEWNRAASGPIWRIILLFLEQPGSIDPPGHGKHIDNVLAEEQEIVGEAHQGHHIQRKQELGNAVCDHLHCGNCQIEHSKDPGLDRNDEEQ